MAIIVIITFVLSLLTVHFSLQATKESLIMVPSRMLKWSCYCILFVNIIAAVAASWRLFRVISGLPPYADAVIAIIAMIFYIPLFLASLFAYLHYKST